jgi:hypothetical protein
MSTPTADARARAKKVASELRLNQDGWAHALREEAADIIDELLAEIERPRGAGGEKSAPTTTHETEEAPARRVLAPTGDEEDARLSAVALSLLRRIEDANGRLLEVVVTGAGTFRTFAKVSHMGLVTSAAHPTLKTRDGKPAPTVVLTAAGRAVLNAAVASS